MNTQTDNVTALAPHRLRPHPTCKIARLPSEAREMINESIADNIPNAEIITRLEAMGHHDITPKNLSRWAYSGYLTWLQHRENKEFLQQQADASADLMRQLDASDPSACSRFNNAYLATQLGQLMRGVNLKPIRKKLESDPTQFFRLVRSINAQTRNTIRQQKVQHDAATKESVRLATEQRDLGQLPQTTSEAGYATAAAYYGLPPRFRVDLPKTNSPDKSDNQNPQQPNQQQATS
jgi:hypothetical protein